MRPRRHRKRKISTGAQARACISCVLRHTVAETRFIRFTKGEAMRLRTAITVSCIAFAASAAPALAQGTPPCTNPNALGLARTVEVDTTGGPGFGFEQYKAHDFLVLKEVVLTFDDGPWPGNTRAVLEALAEQCVKATFFPIGKHALWHPEILKQVVAEGHTVGGHTWSHANLSKGTGK